MQDIQETKLGSLIDCAAQNGFSDEQQEIIATFEKKLKNIFADSKNEKPKPMQIDESGNVVICDGTVFHRTGTLHDGNLESYAHNGVLASEFFGILESEGEGRFCAFLNRVKSDYPESESAFIRQNNKTTNRKNRTPQKDNLIFYFDTSNELMQNLIGNDYFAYAKSVQENPSQIAEIYENRPTVAQMLSQVIYPNSPSGKDMHTGGQTHTHDWLAIPGGVPPSLINGISISSKNTELTSNVEKLKELFPNATIFDEQNKALCKPSNTIEASQRENETEKSL